MMVVHRWLGNWKLARVGTVGALAALIIFHAINNWRWLTTNVTLLGWDLPAHLGTSLIYNRMLRPFTLKTLFAVVTWHPLHPPLFSLSAVLLYRLFGVSVDVGTMVNVLYLALLIGSVYGIGQRLGGRRVGLLAAFVVATFPMIYAMSRYFYLELALTAIVALSVCLLLASDGFKNRTVSLLFGLSFGLGLLTKSTYLVFIFAPLCLAVVRSEALKSLKRRLQGGFRLDIRDVLLALVIGLALATIWYVPGREIATHHLVLGDWLLPLWALLAAMTIYLVRRKPGPDTNFLSALFLGGTMGSLWHLACVTSVRLMLREGFGVNDPQERSANLSQPGTYIHFLVTLINEHISLVYFAFFLIALIGLLFSLRRKGSIRATLRRASDAWWVTLLWLVGSYLLLTLSIYRVSRGITPVLPALALIMSAGLFRLPWRKVVALLVALVIGWGLLQFFVLSYEGPHWLAERTTFTIPVLGETGLFAQGGLIQLPAAGETDPDYWVVPDILRIVDGERQAADAETVRLGVLVNNYHLNSDLLGLLVIQRYAGIQLHDLARAQDEPVYALLFEQDYLVIFKGSYNRVGTEAEEALRHLAEAPEFFAAAFELIREFPLPNGDKVLLYRKAWQPPPGYNMDDYHAVAQTIKALSREGDAILLVPPEQVAALGRNYDGHLLPYLLPQERLFNPETTAQALEEITARHPILFAVFRSDEAADPARFIESWLNEHAYRSQSEWHGSVLLVVYGAPSHRAEIEHPLEVRLGEQIRLLGYSLAEDAVAPGRMVRLTLFWQAEEPVAERIAVFAHLLDGDGRLVAQQDSEPLGGSRPTTTWTTSEVLSDHIGILIPPGTASGEYHLVVGMYRPDTGERLPVWDGEGAVAGDSIPLSMIQVR